MVAMWIDRGTLFAKRLFHGYVCESEFCLLGLCDRPCFLEVTLWVLFLTTEAVKPNHSTPHDLPHVSLFSPWDGDGDIFYPETIPSGGKPSIPGGVFF